MSLWRRGALVFVGLLGAGAALLSQAPARWLADAVAQATDQHLQLADSRGTVWSGSAQAVLGAGRGSPEASRLPGRLHWRWGWQDGAVLHLTLDCCTPQPVVLRAQAGWHRVGLALEAQPSPLLRLPASWLRGLGTPFNTLQLDGELVLQSPQGLSASRHNGPWAWQGGLLLELRGLSTRVATVAPLGSYQLALQAPGHLTLTTLPGAALQLEAQGTLMPRLQLRGEARANAGFETALDNLLNIVGRRDGARSLITLG